MAHCLSHWHFVLNSTSGHLRWDRFVTLNIVNPLVEYGLIKPHPGIPILMYHSISDGPEANVSPYHRTCTSHSRFCQHLALLKSAGYQGVTLTAGLTWLQSNSSPSSVANAAKPARPVAITFDDGFSDFYNAAFPTLLLHGFQASMFLSTAFVGDNRRAFHPRGGSQLTTARDCLTWSEIRELHAAGMEFGSHTVNHPKLVDLDWPEIEFEICNSKSKIEDKLGIPVTSFAYPYAFPQADKDFAKAFRRMLGLVGYKSCVTTIAGRVAIGDDPYTLRRLPVNGEDDPALLLAKLTGAYDWMQHTQRSVKLLKRVVSRRSPGSETRALQ